MRGLLKLELFNELRRKDLSYWGIKTPTSWVAEITGCHPKYKYERRFLRPIRDWSGSNSKGTRGIFGFFLLSENKYYEVNEKTSWRCHERYFAKVSTQGDIITVNEEELISWLKAI